MWHGRVDAGKVLIGSVAYTIIGIHSFMFDLLRLNVNKLGVRMVIDGESLYSGLANLTKKIQLPRLASSAGLFQCCRLRFNFVCIVELFDPLLSIGTVKENNVVLPSAFW